MKSSIESTTTVSPLAVSVSPTVCATLGVVGFAALTALGAQVQVPVPGTLVPMTLQLAAVLATGCFLSAPLAMLAMTLYLAAGTAGLGVFAAGSVGLAGVTGGYLFAFVPAAGTISLLRGRHAGALRIMLAGACGVAIALSMGAWWQASWLGLNWDVALRMGVWPFLSKAMVELGLACAAYRIVEARRLAKVAAKNESDNERD